MMKQHKLCNVIPFLNRRSSTRRVDSEWFQRAPTLLIVALPLRADVRRELQQPNSKQIT